MTISEASRRAKANGQRGKRAERDVVTYLRQAGFGGAERAVRTGYRAGVRLSADPGDITGTPMIVWSVKDAATERLGVWLDELAAMDGPPDAVRVLVHKRRGKASPARWWAWTWSTTLAQLVDPAAASRSEVVVPVRLELGDLVMLLRSAGYGDALEAA